MFRKDLESSHDSTATAQDSPFTLSCEFFQNCSLDCVQVTKSQRNVKGGVGSLYQYGTFDCRLDRHTSSYIEVKKTYKPIKQMTFLKPEDRLPVKLSDRESSIILLPAL